MDSNEHIRKHGGLTFETIRTEAAAEIGDQDYDLETAAEILERCDQAHRISDRIRSLILEAKRAGAFADITEDDSLIQFALEVGTTQTAYESAKAQEIHGILKDRQVPEDID